MISRLIARAIRLPLRLVRPGTVMRILTGPLRGLRWVAGTATHGCWIGTYERETQRVFETWVRPGSVVYDVGANAGFFTLFASRLAGPAGKVYAFEPLPRNIEVLREHVRLNAATNVEIFPLAVSDRIGTARFASADHPAMGGLSERGVLEVETTTLDALRGTLAPPAFVKMDIEGAEHAALTGAMEMLRDAKPVILLSAHGYVQHDLCTALLRALGYELDVLVDGTADGNYVLLARSAAHAHQSMGGQATST